MATIKIINLGTVPNDGNGDPLRNGGQDINDNFAALNTEKTERGGYVGTTKDLENRVLALENVAQLSIVSIGQAAGFNTTQDVETTEESVYGYFENLDINVNTTIDQLQIGSSYTAKINAGGITQPAIYWVNFHAAISSSDNDAYRFRLYVNDQATNIEAILDLSDNSINEGETSFYGLYTVPVTAGDSFEFKVRKESGGSAETIQYESLFFTIEKAFELSNIPT